MGGFVPNSLEINAHHPEPAILDGAEQLPLFKPLLTALWKMHAQPKARKNAAALAVAPVIQ